MMRSHRMVVWFICTFAYAAAAAAATAVQMFSSVVIANEMLLLCYIYITTETAKRTDDESIQLERERVGARQLE